MSDHGYIPYQQHYVPPAQPTYAQQDYHGGDGREQYQSLYGSGRLAINSHVTGGSFATVSSLGTGSNQVAINSHVSGPGIAAHSMGHDGYGAPTSEHWTHQMAELRGSDYVPPARHNQGPVFEMPAEPAQRVDKKSQDSEDTQGMKSMGAAGPSATEQRPVQANPWPFYLDVSPTRDRNKGDHVQQEEEAKKDQEEKGIVQAFPWPYHGPSTADDKPQATVHPPKKSNVPAEHNSGGEKLDGNDEKKPLPPPKDSPKCKTTVPAGKDESVLDDILADMDAQDEEEDTDVWDREDDAQRSQKDPSLRPPPLNLSRPAVGDNARPNVVSPGGKTYIPYRPGASSSTASPTTQSPYSQPNQHHPPVTAPHHVYTSNTQTSLSPPPHPAHAHPPHPASPTSSGGFSPYRPSSPQAPPFAASTGLGIQSPHQGGPASPTQINASPSFVAYRPSPSPNPSRTTSHTHSGLTSPTRPPTSGFPHPQTTPSPRPSASPQPGISHQPSDGDLGASSSLDVNTANALPPYPSSPLPINASVGDERPAPTGHHGKPASPAPLAFYPPPTTQADPVPGRLASPSIGPGVGTPSSRNDSASVHSGVSSTLGGAPGHPQGSQSRPYPSPPSASASVGSQPSHYFSPQMGSQQQQLPPPSSGPPSLYDDAQQTYVSPTSISPHATTSPPSPPQAQRPGVSHAATLPSPSLPPLSPPPPYTPVDLPPRPGSQPAAGSSHQESHRYHQSPPPAQIPQFSSQSTNASSQGHHHYQAQQHQQQHPPPPPPNLNQSLPPLPPRPSTSHNGRPPQPPRPQGFGAALPNATNFPPPPKPNYHGVPPPMPPRPSHHQQSYGQSNKIFGSSSAKKWLDKTERLVEQTFGDILQPQVDQAYRPPAGGHGGSAPYYQGSHSQVGYGTAPPQPQHAPSSAHQQQYPPQHRPSPHHGPFPEQGRGRGRR